MSTVAEVPVVTLTLAEQQAHLDRNLDAALDILAAMLDDPTYREHVKAMARERHHEGYHVFGSAMYAWSAAERGENVNEEIADAAVYVTSGME